MKKREADSELRQLVDGMLDGRLSRAEAARLEERMEEDVWAMDYYLSLSGQEVLLADALKDLSLDSDEVFQSSISKFPVWAGIAAAVAILAGVTFITIRQSEDSGFTAAQENPNAGATLTNEVGATWDGTPRIIGSGLEKGSVVKLSSGLAELTHQSGTRLLIEGPAYYQISGPNSGKLDFGKVVAEVPPGAEGFTIEYKDGKVVDFGTEFAISLPIGATSAEVGVFRGEVRVQQGKDTINDATPLYTGHAIRTASSSTTGLRSIPFDQDQFVRTIPTRELPWFDTGNGIPIELDVSHLVWSDGEYQGVIKWMNGTEALNLTRMELLLNGEVVSTDEHPSSVGNLNSTVENIYHLRVPSGEWKRGSWKLRAWPKKSPAGGSSDGILMFENTTSVSATGKDFTGPWKYMHDGNRYLRKFHPDGSCSLWINDIPSDYFQDAKWEVADGILRVTFPASPVTEDHMLRDGESLLFINQPYRNGRRAQ